MAARVLTTLMKTVMGALSQEINLACVRYWLDSKTALYWIHNNGEWKQFVQHRVNEILHQSRKNEWGHVPGLQNPADIGSRGVDARYLKGSQLWWEGPEWLRKGKEFWPPKFMPESSIKVVSERRKVNVMSVVQEDPMGLGNVIDLARYRNLMKVLRVTAYVLRFIDNLKNRKVGKQGSKGVLSVKEIEAAEKAWIAYTQEEFQKEPEFGNIKVQLGLESEDGVLVCKGRLGESDLDYRAKYPVILPKGNPFTNLVMIDCHSRVYHNKVRSTLAELRSRFWVPQGRQQVKKVISSCQICRKYEGKLFTPPPTAELPKFRVREVKPFANVGIDFAGPLFIKGN